MLAVCRTCLREVRDSNFINLDSVDSSEVKTQLAACVPELELVFVKNAVLCTSCANILHLAYDFKEQCLSIEQHVRRFMLERHTNSISLVEVFKHMNPNWQVRNEDLVPNRKTRADNVTASQLNNLLDRSLQNKEGEQGRVSNIPYTRDDLIEKPEFIVLGEVEYSGNGNTSTHEVNSDSNDVTSTSRDGSVVVDCNTSGQINTQDDDDDDCVEVACCVSEEINDESDSYADFVEVVYRPNIPINNNDYGDGELSCRPEEINHQAVQHNLKAPCNPGMPEDGFVENPNEKVYGCHLCNFRTAYRRSLQAHQKVHSDLRPYKCNICHRRFKNRYNVRAHMWTHTSEKPILCHLCEYRTTRNRTLQSHLKRAHGDLWFTTRENLPFRTREDLSSNVQNYSQ